MSAVNQYLPFATGDGANTLTAEQYAAIGPLLQGFTAGTALSVQANTLFRQLSTAVAGIAQFMADNQVADVLDDRSVANFEAKFGAALKGFLNASSLHYGTATGTCDAMVVASTPPLLPLPTGGYRPGSVLVVRTPAVPTGGNTSTSPTLNADTIGNVAITKRSGGPLNPGDIAASTWIILFFDGTEWTTVSFTRSEVVAAVPATALWHKGTDTSTNAAAVVATASPAVTSSTRVAGTPYLITPANACAGATTIDVGFGPNPLTRWNGTAPAAGDYPAGEPLLVVDDGTNFRIVGLLASDIATAIPPATLWHFGADTSGTAGAIVAPVTPAVTTRPANAAYVVYPANACAGATTINVGYGAVALTRPDGSPTQANDYTAGQPLLVIDNGTTCRLASLLTAAQILNITQAAPPGSALTGTQSNYGYSPQSGVASTLTANFVAPYAGVVQCVSTLNTSPTNGNILNRATVVVNGTTSGGANDTVAGSSVSQLFVKVAKGDTVVVRSTCTPASSCPYNASQYLNYLFIPA